jgi:hypothetical protein
MKKGWNRLRGEQEIVEAEDRKISWDNIASLRPAPPHAGGDLAVDGEQGDRPRPNTQIENREMKI